LLLVTFMLGAILHVHYRRQECSSVHSTLKHGMVSVASALPFRDILSSSVLCVSQSSFVFWHYWQQHFRKYPTR